MEDKRISGFSTLDEDVSARELIVSLAEDIIAEFEHLTLIDKYDVYQVLLAYWNEVMNDDVSLIISESDGYTNARATDNIEEEITQGKNKGEMKVTGWEGRLIPKSIVIDAFSVMKRMLSKRQRMLSQKLNPSFLIWLRAPMKNLLLPMWLRTEKSRQRT